MTTLSQIREFVDHQSAQNIAFSPDSSLLLSGSTDHTVRLWDVETGTELRRFVVPVANHVLIAPNGQTLLVDDTHYAYLWPLDIGDSKTYLCEHLSRDFTLSERECYKSAI